MQERRTRHWARNKIESGITVGNELYYADRSTATDALSIEECRRCAEIMREELIAAGYECSPLRVVTEPLPGGGVMNFAGVTPLGRAR